MGLLILFGCIGAGVFMAASILGKNKPKDVAKDTATGCLTGIGSLFLILLGIIAICALIYFCVIYGFSTAFSE